ncbi:metallophosphoesterase [Micavibrio aeruginosavorus]|uniref:metallophosphoesterase n=1 Tax=Micavibrio aeruginosavorus TaxID=349221 RepID=UPI003F4AAB4D
MSQGYDIIGDVHGRADHLERLLDILGYQHTASSFIHPEGRKVIFIGDLIDRGSQEMRTLRIVRDMVDTDNAYAIMGNHEFNAICYATRDANGDYIRPHTSKNRQQHDDFLREFPMGSAQHTDTIEWMTTLPIYLDLGPLRVVHACWNDDYIDTLTPHLDHGNRINTGLLNAYARRIEPIYTALEETLKGPSIKLPDGMTFKDAMGHERDEARLQWWSDRNAQLDNLVDPRVATIPEQHHGKIHQTIALKNVFNAVSKPTFIGHYSLNQPLRLLSDTIVGVDYRKHLTAYRWDDGEPLSAMRFVHAPAYRP